MSIEVPLPALGESVLEGTISRWLVKEGETVERDQPLVEVTTDKVDAEIPSPVAGVVESLLAAEGETVEIGTALARISAECGVAVSPPRSREAAPAPGPASPASVPAPTPLARRAAAEAWVDPGTLEGSGAHGRVIRADVEGGPAASAAAATPTQGVAPAPSTPAAPRSGPAARPAYMDYQLKQGDEVIPMSPLRRLVAEHMVFSKRVSPHVGTVAEIDLSGIVKVRDAHKRSFRESNGFALSFLPFVVQAAVRALREYPRLNASVVDDAIIEKRDIHMGIAVETEKGLVVPVVRHADRLSLAGLAQAVEDLANRARTKKLSPDELKGGSFTISNPGRDGNLYGFAIINQPQVGILRMGEIVKRPVVRSLHGEDAIVIRPIMHLSLCYDHRAVDGSPANGFLHRIREMLEEAEFDL
jgi:2-oxoglutarate dehydrogenase E2 component (dihydrolipoamide succinyltransferase)